MKRQLLQVAVIFFLQLLRLPVQRLLEAAGKGGVALLTARAQQLPHLLHGQHPLEYAGHHQRGKLLARVALVDGAGHKAILHIVVDDGTGDDAALVLPLKQGQLPFQIGDHLIHIQFDIRHAVPFDRLPGLNITLQRFDIHPFSPLLLLQSV